MSKQPTGPDQFDYDEQDIAGDGPDSTWIPPDEPMGSQSFGTTSAEERAGEVFDQRTRHTNPEVFDESESDVEDGVGRLLQPGDEDVDLVDYESNTVASDEGDDDGDMSAEESAMHATVSPEWSESNGY